MRTVKDIRKDWQAGAPRVQNIDDARRDVLALLDALESNLGLRQEVLAFAVAMECTLRKNDHKGGWKGCSVAWLLSRLEEEVRELRTAPLSQRLDEAADVANFAMMIADVSGALNVGMQPAPLPEVGAPDRALDQPTSAHEADAAQAPLGPASYTGELRTSLGPVAALRARRDELDSKFRSYDLGDRPMSPPAALTRELLNVEAELRAAEGERP